MARKRRGWIAADRISPAMSATSDNWATTALRLMPSRHRSSQCRKAATPASIRSSSVSSGAPDCRVTGLRRGTSQRSNVSVSAVPTTSAPPAASASLRFIRSFTVVSAMSRIVPAAGHRSREDPESGFLAGGSAVFPPFSDFVSESPSVALIKRSARLSTPPVSRTSSKRRAKSGGQERSATSMRPTRLVLTHTRCASSR